VDEDTYVQQGRMWKDAHWAYLHYIFETLGVDEDLLLLGNPVTDEFSHQLMGLITPKDIDGNANPYFDDVTNDDVADGRVDPGAAGRAGRSSYVPKLPGRSPVTSSPSRRSDSPGCTSCSH